MKRVIMITGGLGNQIFCLAAILYFRHHQKNPVRPDISWYSRRHSQNRAFLLPALFEADFLRDLGFPTVHRFNSNIADAKYYALSILDACETRFRVDKEQRAIAGVLGRFGVSKAYWQSAKVVDAVISDLRSQIRRSPQAPAMLVSIPDADASAGIPAIHMRYGDYLESGVYSQVHQGGYYKSALSLVLHMSGQAHFVVYSDDMGRARIDCPPIAAATDSKPLFWAGESAVLDFQRLMCHRYIVTANSTFSWWASRLGQASVIVQPKSWYSDSNLRFDPSGVVQTGPRLYCL